MLLVFVQNTFYKSVWVICNKPLQFFILSLALMIFLVSKMINAFCSLPCTFLPEMIYCVARKTCVAFKCHTQNVSLYVKFYSYFDSSLFFAEHIRNTTDRCIFEKDV